MSIKQKMLSGQKIYGTMLRVVRNPAVCILAKNSGLDFVMFDCEYSNYSIETLHDLCLMANAVDLPGLFRASMLSKDCISRSLDCGASGVMVPMTETRAMAEEIVRWSKYPPIGERGFAAGGAPTGYKGGVKHAEAMQQGNDSVISIAQIETKLAIENAESIAQTPGIDVLLIGPNDLSISLGVPGDTMCSTMIDAIDHVADVCKRNGKAFGIHAGPKLLEKYADRLNFVMMQNDIDILSAGFANIASTLQRIVPQQ
jgi:2-keto-3-deoxy-L-rhamnonate aldolase RhmA